MNRTRQDIEKKILESKHRLVLMEEDAIKRYWNILMIFLLVYVATWVPYQICFNDSMPNGQLSNEEIVDYVVDGLFLVDIIINFFSSYEDPYTGLPVTSFKKISMHYISGWFFLDIIAVLPI